MINWKVRLKNKTFWITAIPAILLLAQQVLAIFGVTIDVANISNQLLAVVGTVFGMLSILGIVTDPTTTGVSDSQQAMTYDEPKGDDKQ